MKSRNFYSQIQLVTAPTTADSQFTVTHELDAIPHGAFVIRRSGSARLYRPTQNMGGAGLSSSFIGGWEFENSGNLGLDSGSNALDLTNNNAVTQAAGIVGNAGSFASASTQYLWRASEALLQVGDIDFTVATWVYPASAATAAIAAKDNPSVAGAREWLLAAILSGGSIFPRFHVFTPVDTIASVTHTSALSLNTWQLLVAWHDAAADTIYIQLNNGTPVSTATGGALQAASSAQFRIGARDGASPIPWNGRIDQTMFWKRVLTTSERTALYNSGSGLTVASALAAQDIQLISWTSTDAYLKCDTGDARFYVLFFV